MTNIISLAEFEHVSRIEKILLVQNLEVVKNTLPACHQFNTSRVYNVTVSMVSKLSQGE